MVILIGGGSSALIAGRLGDHFEPINYGAKGWISVIMSLCGFPTFALCFLINYSYYFSLAFYFLAFLLSEGWMALAMSTVQTVSPLEVKGICIALFFCAINLSGTMAMLLVGHFIDQPDAKIGLILAINTALPCLVSAACFYCTIKPYKLFKQAGEAERGRAFSKAETALSGDLFDEKNLSKYRDILREFSNSNYTKNKVKARHTQELKKS